MAPDAWAEAPSDETLDKIKSIVGDKGWTDTPNTVAPWLTDWRGHYTGQCALMVRPATAEETAQVVAVCAAHEIAIVPQGGNTGMCAAATPHPHGREILLNLGRLNRIRAIDPLNYTVTVEAGCILQEIQQRAAEADRLFPLSLGAEGSCQIGGNLSTNAGGVNVLRYGNARDLTLGLEVVLPSGEIWDGLRRLRKDNTGYDLKHLFIGGEGTLGIITAAVLKLFPLPKDVQTCFAAVRDPDAVLTLLSRARSASGDSVSSFEMMGRFGIDLAIKHVDGVVDPLRERHDLYALIEFSGARADGGMAQNMQTLLETAFESGLVLDAAIARSNAQRASFWKIREAITEAQAIEGGSIKHDISVPVSRVPDFLRQATQAVIDYMPGIRPCTFGHVGDGNLHYNFSQPAEMERREFLDHWREINRIVHDIVVEMGGSISAEHGIGQLKRDELRHYKPSLDLDIMRRIKAAIDPKGLLNPGKLL